MRLRHSLALLASLLATAASGADLGSRSIAQWDGFLEWSLTNTTWSGNPFDVAATVIYTHQSGEVRRIPLYHAGGQIWRFRFCPSRAGSWSFTTVADGSGGTTADPELHGHTGTISVGAPAAGATGFLVTSGKRFALERPDGLDGYLLNIYEYGYGRESAADCLTRMDYFTPDNVVSRNQAHIDKGKRAGMEVLHVFMSEKYSTWHDSTTGNPRVGTFDLLDTMFAMYRQQGMRAHFWQWGDGGGHAATGDALKRLNRYIGARLGPQIGWSMSYGYDLSGGDKGNDWALALHQVCGWRHLLWARWWTGSELDATANDYRSEVASNPYQHALDTIAANPTRPIVYERRFWKDRDQFTEAKTLQGMWEFALAGGAACWWGELASKKYSDQAAERYRTHYAFWRQGRRFRLDLVPANSLTDGRCLAKAGSHYVFHKTGTSSIRCDLRGASGSLPAVAVDCLKGYQEVALGSLAKTDQVVALPYASDWAIAVGTFGGGGSNQAPTVSAASASPTPVTGTTASLSATASDDGGEAALRYTWSASGPATVSFSPNGTNAAKAGTATFAKAGSYTLTITVTDGGGLTASKSVTVSVQATATAVAIEP